MCEASFSQEFCMIYQQLEGRGLTKRFTGVGLVRPKTCPSASFIGSYRLTLELLVYASNIAYK
jgi:hypothetical protein